MGKWIATIVGTVIGGVLLAWAMNWIGPKPDPVSRPDPVINDMTPPPPPPEEGPPVMGPLEEGINRQGLDLSAIEKPAANAPLCAEMCRTEAKCDAMTYVKSTGMCWMKSGVPAASSNPDMISAVKVRKKSADAAM